MKHKCLFTSLVACIVLAASAQAQTWTSDSLAIQSILAFNGLPTNNVSSYVVKRSGRAEELRLDGLNLTAIPPEIGDLTALIYLDLSDNALESLPEEIGNLREIQTIYLHNNQLIELPAGITSIPTSHRIQTTEYGCQIYYDGNCIAWGPVLVTKNISTRANLGTNRLCNEGSSTTNWANAVDSDWRSTQDCSGSVRPSTWLGIIKSNEQNVPAVSVYNIQGQIVQTFSKNGPDLLQSKNNQNELMPGGLYILKLKDGSFRKIILLD